MEYAKKYRWALVGFIILLVVNIGTLATIWMMRPPQQLPAFANGEGQPRRVQRFLERELNLNQQQRSEIRQLRQQHLSRMRSVREEIHRSRDAYLKLLQNSDSPTNKKRVDSLATLIGRAHAQLERANYEHFTQMRALLNSDQRARFDTLLEQSLRGPQRRGRTEGLMNGPRPF